MKADYQKQWITAPLTEMTPTYSWPRGLPVYTTRVYRVTHQLRLSLSSKPIQWYGEATGWCHTPILTSRPILPIREATGQHYTSTMIFDPRSWPSILDTPLELPLKPSHPISTSTRNLDGLQPFSFSLLWRAGRFGPILSSSIQKYTYNICRSK